MSAIFWNSDKNFVAALGDVGLQRMAEVVSGQCLVEAVDDADEGNFDDEEIAASADDSFDDPFSPCM